MRILLHPLLISKLKMFTSICEIKSLIVCYLELLLLIVWNGQITRTILWFSNSFRNFPILLLFGNLNAFPVARKLGNVPCYLEVLKCSSLSENDITRLSAPNPEPQDSKSVLQFCSPRHCVLCPKIRLCSLNLVPESVGGDLKFYTYIIKFWKILWS